MEDLSSSVILENIRQIRHERRYSQEYMAISLTVSQNAYSKLERGRTKLTWDRLAEIANILETSMEELLKDAGRDSRRPRADNYA